MTVQELINKLIMYPSDTRVMFTDVELGLIDIGDIEYHLGNEDSFLNREMPYINLIGE